MTTLRGFHVIRNYPARLVMSCYTPSELSFDGEHSGSRGLVKDEVSHIAMRGVTRFPSLKVTD